MNLDRTGFGKYIGCSDEALCASATYLFPVQAKKEIRQSWLKNHELYTCKDGRVYAKVRASENSIRLNPQVFYMMDCITGSLYLDGHCLTSVVLKVDNFTRNQKVASKKMMAITLMDVGRYR